MRLSDREEDWIETYVKFSVFETFFVWGTKQGLRTAS